MAEIEFEKKPAVQIINAAPHGLGFGEGAISFSARQVELTQDELRAGEAVVTSPDVLIAVSIDKKTGKPIDDDGCGDGRYVARVFEGETIRKKSLNRAKVFGGGATMATASLIGLKQVAGLSLRDAFAKAMRLLHERGIDFGAHTDTHAEGNNCGCGAIDKAPQIIANVVKFESAIRAAIGALGVDQTGLDEVLSAYREYVKTVPDQPYAGADIIKDIIASGKVVKELDDSHKEIYVLLNTIEGYTVDQEKIRQATGGKAQTFAVDVWRVKQLAERLFADRPAEVRHQAFLSELVYTLATAGTLTKGDLPVYILAR